MTHETKADFRALRERLGLTQKNLADAVGVELRTVKRWEHPGWGDIPEDVWAYIERMEDSYYQSVEIAIEKAVSLSDSTGVDSVTLTYYRDQEQYDACGRDDGPVGYVNAMSRDVAAELERCGITVSFRYPDDGAIRTPGSNY